MGISEETGAGLVRFVSYDDIQKAYGVSRSTIERAWSQPEEGKPQLPPPGKIGGRSVWPVPIVNYWGRELCRHMRGFEAGTAAINLDKNAQCYPDSQFDEQARSLAARVLSKQLGKPVEPEAVEVDLVLFQTHEGLHESLRAQLQRLSELRFMEAALIAASLLPQLRELLWTLLPGISDVSPDDILKSPAADTIRALVVLGSLAADTGVERVLDAAVNSGRLSPAPKLGLIEPGQPDRQKPTRYDSFGVDASTFVAAWEYPDLIPKLMLCVGKTECQMLGDEDFVRRASAAAFDAGDWAAVDAKISEWRWLGETGSQTQDETAEEPYRTEPDDDVSGPNPNDGHPFLDRNHGYGTDRSAFAAAWQYPNLIPVLARFMSHVDRQLLADDDFVSRAAFAAQGDASWTELATELAERRRRGHTI